MRMRSFVLAVLWLALLPSARAEYSYGTVGTGPSAVMDIGMGLPVYSNEYSQQYNSGTVGWSLNADILSQIGSSSFLWGVDMSLNFYGFNPTNSQVAGAQFTHSALGIAPLLTVLYRFDGVAGTDLHPRFGVATGPSVYLQRNRFTNPNTGQADSNTDTSIRWQTMLRPGLEWQIAKAFSVTAETDFGLISSDFIFQPEIRLSLLL